MVALLGYLCRMEIAQCGDRVFVATLLADLGNAGAIGIKHEHIGVAEKVDGGIRSADGNAAFFEMIPDCTIAMGSSKVCCEAEAVVHPGGASLYLLQKLTLFRLLQIGKEDICHIDGSGFVAFRAVLDACGDVQQLASPGDRGTDCDGA